MEKMIYCQKSRIPSLNMEDIIDGEAIKVEGVIYERLLKRPNNRRPIRSLINEDLQQRLVRYG